MIIEIRKTNNVIRHIKIIIGDREYQISEEKITGNLEIMKNYGEDDSLVIMPRVTNVIEIR